MAEKFGQAGCRNKFGL